MTVLFVCITKVKSLVGFFSRSTTIIAIALTTLPTESLPELPQNLNIVCLVDCLSSGNPVHADHASAVKKRGHQKFVGGFDLSGLLGSWRTSMLPLGIVQVIQT